MQTKRIATYEFKNIQSHTRYTRNQDKLQQKIRRVKDENEDADQRENKLNEESIYAETRSPGRSSQGHKINYSFKDLFCFVFISNTESERVLKTTGRKNVCDNEVYIM